MITPLQLIVLNVKPYKETSLLVNTYTNVRGRTDFVVNGVRTARNRAAAAVFHPLSILDTRAYLSEKRTLHRLKEYQKALPLNGLCTNVRKSTIGLFMAELVYKTVREYEENSALYQFLKESIVHLDKAEEELPDVHLYFTVRLCKYLGYAPEQNDSESPPDSFNIQKGRFTRGPGAFGKEDSLLLHRILSVPPHQYEPLPCSGAERYHFLMSMMEYYG